MVNRKIVNEGAGLFGEKGQIKCILVNTGMDSNISIADKVFICYGNWSSCARGLEVFRNGDWIELVSITRNDSAINC